MDPGTALGAISLATECCKDLKKYYDSFRNQDAVVATALKSAEDLQETLSSLKRIIRDKQRYDAEIIAQLSTRIASCKDQAEALKKKTRKIHDNTPREKLTEKLRGLPLRALYPFRESTLVKLREIMQDMRDNLLAALNTLQFHATDLINDDLKSAAADIRTVGSDVKAVDGKLTGVATGVTTLTSNVADVSQITSETQSGVQDLSVDVSRVEKTVGSIDEDSKSFRREYADRNIMEWLSPVDTDSNHAAARKKHESGSGNWILKNQTFQNWKGSAGSLLWINGNPGCGKTILASTIIDDLRDQSHIQAGSELAFFYFSFADSRKQSCNAFFTSIVAQLFQARPSSRSLHSLYSRHGYGKPSTESLSDVLLEMVDECADVYIVIDALDECSTSAGDQGEMLDWLQQMAERKIDKLRILILSRKEPDIKQALETSTLLPSISLAKGDLNDDISLYVHGQLRNDRKLKELGAATKELIAQKLLEGANGMFRWVFCQLEELKKLRPLRVSAYKRKLQSLPATLDETYERILLGLKDNQQEVFKALQWLAFSLKPLDIQCLTGACDVGPHGDVEFNGDDKIMPQRLLETLASLIVEEGAMIEYELPATIRLAHYSVKEYLVSDRILQSQASEFSLNAQIGHKYIVESCLAYISYWHKQRSKPLGYGSRTPGRDRTLKYACCHWYKHMQFCSPSDRKRLSDDTAPKFAANSWLGRWIPYDFDKMVDMEKLTFSCTDDSDQVSYPALYHAAVRGLDLVAENLLQCNSNPKISAQIEIDRALQAASSQGLQSTVESLVRRGANVNLNSYATPCGNALLGAVYNDHWDIFQLLLSRGANYEAFLGGTPDRYGADPSRLYGNPLQAASVRGYEKYVEELLNRGVNPDSSDESFPLAPLHLASSEHHLETVELLLKTGANINHQSFEMNWTPLHIASFRGYEDIVGILLNKGANTCVRLEPDRTSAGLLEKVSDARPTQLLEGIPCASEDILFYPLSQGIRDDWTALHLAADKGHDGVAKLLLDHGADPDLRSQQLGVTALEVASSRGYVATARNLLDAGAQVYLGGNLSAPAVQAARQDPYYEEILPRAAADAHTNTDFSINFAGMPDSLIADIGLMSLLKRFKEEIHLGDSRVMEVWKIAICRGASTAVKFLIDNGARVNADWFESDILSLTMDDHGTIQHRDLFDLLLDNGADINGGPIININGRDDFLTESLLQHACYKLNTSTTKLLLDRGAEVNDVDEHSIGETPLQILCEDGTSGAVKMLLERGADVLLELLYIEW